MSNDEGGCWADAVLRDRGCFSRIMELLPLDSDRPFIRAAADQPPPLTYRQLGDFVQQVCCRLRGLGIQQSDRVAVAIPNSPAAAVSFLAFSAACCYAPLSVSLSRGELEWTLVDLPAAALVVAAGTDATDQRAVARTAGVPVLELQVDPTAAGMFTLTADSTGPALVPRPMRCGEEPAEREYGAPVMMLYTSGTTSKAKLVPLTDQNLGCAALCIAQTLGLQPSDVCLNLMPLYHLHGLAVNVLATAVGGASVVCAPGLQQPASFFSIAAAQQVNWYSAVPSIHLSLLEHLEATAELAPPPLRFIRNCSAALLPSIAHRMEIAFGCAVLATYAMTECIPYATAVILL